MINRVLLCCVLFIIGGCYYDKEDLLYPGSTVDCSTVNAKFIDVKPVVVSKCATSGCHNTATAAGGVVLETYSQISNTKDRIMQRAIRDKTMPPSTPLSSAEIALITCWINSGALNN